MSELRIWGEKRYQLAADSIRCVADREGCEVFEVSGEIGVIPVLAHDRSEAEKTYDDEVESDPRWCDACQSLNCFCGDDPDED